LALKFQAVAEKIAINFRGCFCRTLYVSLPWCRRWYDELQYVVSMYNTYSVQLQSSSSIN